MAHRFTVNATIHGVSLDDFRRLAADPEMHEAVCKRIPGEKLEILDMLICLRDEYNRIDGFEEGFRFGEENWCVNNYKNKLNNTNRF